MRRSAWLEKLNGFKDNERPEAVLLVAGNSQLTRIVVAWTNMDVSRARKLTKCNGSDDETVWYWLWENVTYSKEEFTSKSGVAEATFENKLNALIGNRVLYPDGTINAFVQRYLRAKVLRLLDVRAGKGVIKAG